MPIMICVYVLILMKVTIINIIMCNANNENIIIINNVCVINNNNNNIM